MMTFSMQNTASSLKCQNHRCATECRWSGTSFAHIFYMFWCGQNIIGGLRTLQKEQMTLLLKLEWQMKYCRCECSWFNSSFSSSSCLSGFWDHKLMIHVCGLCIQPEDPETLRPHEDGPNNNGNAWFHPKVYAIVHDAKKYPFAAMLDFGKWALGRSIHWEICVMSDAGWKIITLENQKENTKNICNK